MDISFLLAGVIIGSITGFFVGKYSIYKALSTCEKEKIEKDVLVEQLNSQVEDLKTSILNETEKKNQLSNDLKDTEIKLGQKSVEIKNLNERFIEFKEETNTLQKQLKIEFKNIANEIVKEQSKDFSEHNSNLLNPFKTQLESFEKTIQTQLKDNIERDASFKAQLEKLTSLNKEISQEAANLTNALKGDNKFQGNWGELILERVLESSGLEKGAEYHTQVSLTNADDNKIQPDAIVHLPDNKHIIIDSKVSLVAYEQYVNSNNNEEREQYLKAHLLSVKNHIKQLSEKKYQTAEGLTTPDFILLFVPIEASFGLAVKEDVEVFNYAWNKNIVIVSPSTLLATLKTIASLWKQEKQNKNVLKIAEESGKLYDKFVGFVSDLSKIEKSLDKTSKDFSEAQKKLIEGRGNIVSRIQKIKELGAKTTKQIDERYLEE